jgi:hypothetical protein
MKMNKVISYKMIILTVLFFAYVGIICNEAVAQQNATYNITGKVTDSQTGLPVQSSICVFSNRIDASGNSIYDAIDKTIPDADGFYKFTLQGANKYKIVAYPWNNDYYPLFYNNADNINDATVIELNKDYSDINFAFAKKHLYENGIHGIVKNSKGEGVAANVYARPYNDVNSYQYSVAPDNSNPGKFTIINLRPGKYILYAYPMAANLYDGFYKENDIAVKDPNLATVITVPETGIISTDFIITLADKDLSSIIYGLKGIIQDESGTGLQGVKIALTDQDGKQVVTKEDIITDDNGYFYFTFSGYITGKFILTANKEGYKEASAGFYFDENNPYQSIILILNGPPRDNGIKGIVTRANGEGVYAKLTLLKITADGSIDYNKYGKSESTDSDKPGEFLIKNIVPGKYVILAYPEEGGLYFGYYKANSEAVKDLKSATIISVNESGINTENYVIILPKGQIKTISYELYGYVVDDNNTPISDVTINVTDSKGNDVTVNQKNISDQSGMFHIYLNSPGTFQIRATKEGYIDASGTMTFNEAMPVQKTHIKMSLKTSENAGKQDSQIIAGVNDEIPNGTTSIYPNPADNTLYINNNGTKICDNIRIYDVTGNQILKASIDLGNSASIDISELQAGAYIVRLLIGDKLIETKMFVKK